VEVILVNGQPKIKAWVEGVEFEEKARQQVDNIARLPFIFKHVAIMPDVHYGIGATVGSVIATKGAVIPAAVGVDLGCGMIAQRTSLKASDLPDDLGPLRLAIEEAIPHGRSDNGGPNDKGAWKGSPPADVLERFEPFAEQFENIGTSSKVIQRAENQLGTLGTGNHFVEICLDENQGVWVMLHSGSRGVGNILATEYIELAKAHAAKYFYESFLPDKDLAYLPDGTPEFHRYVTAVEIAQAYAMANRRLMMEAALNVLVDGISKPFGIEEEAVNCHHNYLSRENHFGQNVLVTRKGAVRAREGELGIIPGSMGAKSFIVRGKGNRESFMSCSHGAGRRMGRNEAKKRISMDDFNAAMGNVESRRDESVLDEAPQAYKSIDAVMAAQSDLVDVVRTLKQVLCVKG